MALHKVNKAFVYILNVEVKKRRPKLYVYLYFKWIKRTRQRLINILEQLWNCAATHLFWNFKNHKNMNGVHWFLLYKITNTMNYRYVISRNLLDEYFCNLLYVQKILHHPSNVLSLNLTFFVLFSGLCNFYLCNLNNLLNFLC